MGNHQAQEGRHRRPPRQDVRELIKNIEVAARTGGGDPDGNPTLFDAIQKAKKSSVPNDNIDRAVKRGSARTRGRRGLQTITTRATARGGVDRAHRVPHRHATRPPPPGEAPHRDDPQDGGQMADRLAESYLVTARAW
jgi:hypothetical protein